LKKWQRATTARNLGVEGAVGVGTLVRPERHPRQKNVEAETIAGKNNKGVKKDRKKRAKKIKKRATPKTGNKGENTKERARREGVNTRR